MSVFAPQRFRTGTLLLALAAACAARLAADAPRSPQAYLEWMQAALTEVPEWNAWQAESGELPPDFATMPSRNALPDPRRFLAGGAVDTAADWPARRAEILEAFQRWQWGRMPPKPRIAAVEDVEQVSHDGYRSRTVRLRFGPGEGGALRVRVTLPDGDGPFPAVITTSLDGWRSELIPRGYAAVGFSGNDFMDDTAGIETLYPEADFAALPRRAWAVQLVVDHLLEQPEIDGDRIALYGYSRDGKMATIAAAWDPRIAAVIAGSTGVGGVLPWRLAGEAGMGEGIASTTMMFPHWFHPRLRFFAGHEDRLPVDANLLVAAIAPRACLIQYGQNDEVSNGWALEQTYDSARAVYALFDASDRLGLLREPGFHGSIDPQRCIDWLDIQFGRAPPGRTWGNDRQFAWDFEAWRARTATEPVAAVPPVSRSREDTLAAVRWMLGEAPAQPPPTLPPWLRGPRPPAPGPTHAQGAGPGQLAPDVPAWVISRGRIQEFGWMADDNATVDSVRLRFGAGLHGDLFYPRDTPEEAKLPTVIWLHGFSYPLGYMWVYRRDLHPVLALAQAGYAVFAFDQSGFGYRQDEAGPFYDRYPGWSRLGRMVADVRAALDVLVEQGRVDPERIQALGYALGGMVALHAAALDERLAGVVSVGGFNPWRPGGDVELARWSREHGLLPRLGRFAGAEETLPYDLDDLLTAMAPRPVLVVQPAMDRTADPAAVRTAVERARTAYRRSDAADALGWLEPDDYLRFPTATQDAVVRWMQTHFP